MRCFLQELARTSTGAPQLLLHDIDVIVELLKYSLSPWSVSSLTYQPSSSEYGIAILEISNSVAAPWPVARTVAEALPL